jgi:DNA-binding Lrp family transcriptional regulator
MILDETKKKILNILQEDTRITNVQFGKKVHFATSNALRS